MPHASRQSAQDDGAGPVEVKYQHLDGYTVDFMSFHADVDTTPLLKGLPDDSCQCPHWGYVLKGRLTFRFPDHEEVFEAGDAFYLPPGHIQIVEAGTEYVQFSPTGDREIVGATLKRNMAAAMQRSGGARG